MRHDSTNGPDSRQSPDSPVIRQHGGDGLPEQVRAQAEAIARQSAGNAIGRLFRWAAQRLGIKKRRPPVANAAENSDQPFEFDQRRGVDRRRPDRML